MAFGFRRERLNAFLAAMAVTGVLGGSVMAEDAKPAAAAPAGPNTGNVSFLLDVQLTTAYYFRGLLQENEQVIIQPAGYLSVDLSDAIGADQGGPISGLSLDVGIWNSVHDAETGGAGSTIPALYETDYIVGATIKAFDRFAFNASYVAYTSPNGAFSTVHELDLRADFDDSDLWGITVNDKAVSFNPHVLLAFELQGEADAGNALAGLPPVQAVSDEGVYLELGIAPSIPIIASEDYPVTLSIPVTVGLDLDADYYETLSPTGSVSSSSFGYLDLGLMVSTPLTSFVPSDYGRWEVRAGAHFIFLGNSTEDFADLGPGGTNHDFDVVGVVGVSGKY